MKYKFGFIGTGNMGGAIARAVANQVGGENIALYNRTALKAEILADEINANVVGFDEIVRQTKFLIIGVKPQGLGELLEKIKITKNGCDKLDNQVIITMAAAKTCGFISDILGKITPVIRIMPNMPVAIGEGVVLTSVNENVSDEDYQEYENAFKKCGLIAKMDESKIDAAMALSGCGPAYIYMVLEALRDGAKKLGIGREEAQEYAIKTMYGSVKLLMDTGQDLSELRESICSPGGTTIEGVKVLKKGKFDDLIYSCLEAAYNRSKDL